MIVKTMLKIIQVARGKKNVNFSLFIKISPGSFPKKGIFGLSKSKTPIEVIIRPAKIVNLAISLSTF